MYILYYNQAAHNQKKFARNVFELKMNIIPRRRQEIIVKH